MSVAAFSRRHRTALIAGGAIVVLLVVAIGAFPFGMLRSVVADRLSHRFGRPVTIGAVERQGVLGFVPTVVLRDVHVPQAAWAGRGELARIERIVVRFPVWPLLLGRLRPRSVVVDGMSLDLVRAADGRTNWGRPGASGGGSGGGGGTTLADLTIARSIVAYRDAKRDRSMIAIVTSDATRGVRVDGQGRVAGTPVTLTLRGAPVQRRGDARWPVNVRIDGPALHMAVAGATDRPLDTAAMTLNIVARARDLKLIDAVIEAGLFGTQPVALAAHVRHQDRKWIVDRLRGTIGHSALDGHVTIDKSSGRSVIAGTAHLARLDFDDLSSDEGLAKAAALTARIGKRLVPNTRVDLSHMARTDGRIDVTADRIVSRKGPSTLTALKATLTLDHQRLEVAPIRVGLTQGALTGRAVVDQRGGARVPRVTLDLWMRGASVATVMGAGGGDPVTGRLTAHGRLVGRGATIREAVGHGTGQVGIVACESTLPSRYAAALGFDPAKALLAGRSRRAALRCVVLRLPIRDGRGTPSPLVIDTSESQARGTGSIVFPSETLSLRLAGAPKGHAAIHLDGPVMLTGAIRAPHLVVPPQTRSAGSILKAIGRAIGGDTGPHPGDADCPALAARALG